MRKEYIIKEIIRTTKRNNGIPLGSSKFENETGIKYTDWFGKYWPKWSDAILEAGFKPNILNPAYDENWLIEQIILLIRELNKFPTKGEIKMRSFNTNDFPHHETFRNRLGNKPEIIRKILDYSKNKAGYEDIVELFKNNKDAFKEPEEEDSIKKPDVQLGYVYLMKMGHNYKIGKSNSVERRNYELGTKLPDELQIIHKINTDDPSGIEAYWHKRFETKRKKGEWFDLSSSDIMAFKRRKFM